MGLRIFDLKTKVVFVSLFMLQYVSTDAQESSVKLKVQTLKKDIAKAKNYEKLELLDSLHTLVLDKPEYQYDSIARKAITYAMELDSINLAGQYMSDLVFYYANSSETPEKGMLLFKEFEELNLQIKDNILLAKLYMNGGDSYFFSGELKESISLYNKSEIWALKAKDSALYARARTYKAGAIVDMGNYAIGSQLLSEVVKILTVKKDTSGLLIARNTLATLYSKMGFFENAKKERDEVIALSVLAKDYNSLQSNLHNASIDADKIGDQKSRIAYLKEAYAYGFKSNEGFSLKPIISYNLLRAYADNDSLVKAKTYYENIQRTYGTRIPIPYESTYRSALADYYIATHDYRKALPEAQKALNMFLDANLAEEVFESYNRLAKIYKKCNDYKNAYAYTTKYNHYRDSVNSLKKARTLSYYQTLYEMEKRDFKIAEQASQISLLDAENKINKQWMLFGGTGLLLLFLIIYLLRSRKFIAYKKELQENFSQDLLHEQEKERVHLARELHDSVGQKLMLLSKTIKNTVHTNAKHLVDTTLEEIRQISRGLHPSNLERLGLTMAINAMIYEINSNTDLFFSEDVDNIDGLLSRTSELHFYRIIQETLNNIVKHSEAKAVKINIKKVSETIEMFIRDNGKGFSFDKNHSYKMSLGMKTIEERAKIINTNLNIESYLGKGTVITLSIPLKNE